MSILGRNERQTTSVNAACSTKLILENSGINNEEMFVTFGNEHFKSKSFIYAPEILNNGL